MMSLSQTTGYAIQALSCLDETGAVLAFGKDISVQSGVRRPAPSRKPRPSLHLALARLTEPQARARGQPPPSPRGDKGGSWPVANARGGDIGPINPVRTGQ